MRCEVPDMKWSRFRRLFGSDKDDKERQGEQPSSEAGVQVNDQLLRVGASKTEKIIGDVVFVHGLDGDQRTTWQPEANEDLFFPRMLGADLPSVAMWSVGYDVSSLAWKGHTMPLVDRAINILALLDANNFGGRPIVFVAHSLGGLLVKQMLRHAVSYGNTAWQRIAEQTKGVVFLSTPHAGSELGTWLQYMRLLLPTVSTQELEAHQPNLRDLNLWYRNAVTGGSLKVKNLVFYEKRLTHGLLVVNATSADPGIPGVIPIPIDADHIGICKPRLKSGTLYASIERFVAERVGGCIDQASNLEPGIQEYATGAKRNTSRPHNSRFHVIGFDLDGTLLRGYQYSWTLVWRHLDVSEAIWKEARRQYVTGKRTYADYKAWCHHDYLHMRERHLKRQDFAQITSTVFPTKNLEKALRALRTEGFVLALISGGIDAFVEEKVPNAKELFDYICINRLHYDDQGIISGIDATPFDFGGKAAALKAICEQHNVTLAQAVFVGEGNNDEDVANAVSSASGLSIAYPPHGEVIPAASRVEVEDDDLLKILDHVLN
jgi:HAD superfamily phosphoserine phosphatase-like hydrolase